jgi:hypothetical protein
MATLRTTGGYTLVALALNLSGCASTPPKMCDVSRPLGPCEYDRVYSGGRIQLLPDTMDRPYCAKITLGIRMSRSMEGPWRWKTYYAKPGQTISLPPGTGETNPQSCEAYGVSR